MRNAVRIYRVIKWLATNPIGWWLVRFVIGPLLACLGIIPFEDIAENVGTSENSAASTFPTIGSHK